MRHSARLQKHFTFRKCHSSNLEIVSCSDGVIGIVLASAYIVKFFLLVFFSGLSECQVFWLDALTMWGWLLYRWRYRNLVLFLYRWIHTFPVKEAIIASMYISVNISKSCEYFCRDWCLGILFSFIRLHENFWYKIMCSYVYVSLIKFNYVQWLS